MQSRPVALGNWDEVKAKLKSVNPALTEEQLNSLSRKLINDGMTINPRCKPVVSSREIFRSSTHNHQAAGRKFTIEEKFNAHAIDSEVRRTKLSYGELFVAAGNAFDVLKKQIKAESQGISSKPNVDARLYELAKADLEREGRGRENEGFVTVLNDEHLLRELTKNEHLLRDVKRSYESLKDDAVFQQQFKALQNEKTKKAEYLAADFDPSKNGDFSSVKNQIEKGIICPQYKDMKLDFTPSGTYFKINPVSQSTKYYEKIMIEVPFPGDVATINQTELDQIKENFKKHPQYTQFQKNIHQITKIEIVSSTAPYVPHPDPLRESVIKPDHMDLLQPGTKNLGFSQARAETMRNLIVAENGLLRAAELPQDKIQKLSAKGSSIISMDYFGTNKGPDGKPNGTRGELCPYVRSNKPPGYEVKSLDPGYADEQRKAYVTITYKVDVPIETTQYKSSAQLDFGVPCQRVSVSCP